MLMMPCQTREKSVRAVRLVAVMNAGTGGLVDLPLAVRVHFHSA